MIGSTNRSVPGYNNSLLFAPALIATKDDLNRITEAVGTAIKRVLG
jgi:taurine-pyruvate aminotransferase